MGDTYVQRVHSFKYICHSSSEGRDTIVTANTIYLVEKLDQQPTLKRVQYLSNQLTPEHGTWQLGAESKTLMISFNSRYGRPGFNWLSETRLRKIAGHHHWEGEDRHGNKIRLEHITEHIQRQNGDWDVCCSETTV